MPSEPGPDPRVVRFQTIDSTSAHARREIAAGRVAFEPVVYVAETQTGGVGRFGRPWASPAGGLWLTLAQAVPSGEIDGCLRGLGLRIGVACLRAVQACAVDEVWSSRVTLKWPNDVLIDGRKVLGVLTELIPPRPGAPGFVIVGVGINANLRSSNLPGDLRGTATTLMDALGRPADLAAVEARAITEIVAAVAGVGAPVDLRHEAERALHGRGGVASVSLPGGGRRAGVLRGLDEDGMAVFDAQGERFVPPLGSVITVDA